LSDKGISLSQILLLKTDKEGTTGEAACQKEKIKAMLTGGLTPVEAVLPYTRPDMSQGLLFQ
jgi:hypothetical protein